MFERSKKANRVARGAKTTTVLDDGWAVMVRSRDKSRDDEEDGKTEGVANM